MKRAMIYALPVAMALVLLPQKSEAQCATCGPPATFCAPQTQQVFQPVVQPSTVVVEQPRRCCLLRFCDWLCGRTPPQPVIAATPIMQTQAVSFAPAATFAPACCPPCSCSACPTDCSTCPSCSATPAPALSSRMAPQSTFAAYGNTAYGSPSAVQQANYAYSASPNTAYYGQQATMTQPSYTTAQPYGSAGAVHYEMPRVRMTETAPKAYAPQVVIPQDRTARTTYAPVQQAAYTAPTAQVTARPTYVQPAAPQPVVTWASGR